MGTARHGYNLKSETSRTLVMRTNAESFLSQYPGIDTIEVLITDCNGISRGKWLPADKLSSILTDGIKLPKSALAQDIWGRDVPPIALDNGDIDGICKSIPESLTPVLGATGVNQAQVLVTMFRDDGKPLLSDPRQVLAKVISEFNQRELVPRVAIELEFNLFNNPKKGQSIKESLPDLAETGGNLYGLSDLDSHTKLLEDLQEAFRIQSLPFEGILKESAPNQYEINLPFSDNALTYCDQIIRIKRRIRAVASRFNIQACFMAKPMENQAGNGMHVHCSLLDKAGRNIFDSKTLEGVTLLERAVAGCLAFMGETFLIFAPNINSYRRFQAGNHAPTHPTWGYDNRTTALRIPAGPSSATRIEHRLPGADCNPYLVVAAILSGMLMGIDKDLLAPAPTEGNAWLKPQNNLALPQDMRNAFEYFSKGRHIKKYLSSAFQTAFSEVKKQELAEFDRRVTDFELKTYW